MTLFDLFAALFRRRRGILAAIAIGMVLLTPARANSLATSTDLGGLSQLGAAAAEFGVNIGTGTGDTSPLFPEILASRAALEALLARKYPTRDGRQTDLVSALEVSADTPELTREYTIKSFAELLLSSYDMKSGATTLSVTPTRSWPPRWSTPRSSR